MDFIKNYGSIAINQDRKVVLDLIEEALTSIQPENVLRENFQVEDGNLKIKDKTVSLKDFERVFLIGFGKGSAEISRLLEEKLRSFLTAGFDIDTVASSFTKIEFTLGTHPLPSSENFEYTKKVLEKTSKLTEKDLVFVVICGGGSVMFESPRSLALEELINVNKTLLKNGADIKETNIIRKHLSKTKGGGLAKHLYPAKVFSLIFSDVPGNDLSVIASGPTVKDETTVRDAFEIYKKYIMSDVLKEEDFEETPKDDIYFEKTENILMLSNLTAINAMEKKAKELGFQAYVYSDKFQSVANIAGKILVENAKENSILLAGGETTVKVKGNGKGGRNQELVLGALETLDDKTIIASFDSDGWDNSESAGAIADINTLNKARELGLNHKEFLDNNNSLEFFEKLGDAIITGKLSSNVSDLMIVFKND